MFEEYKYKTELHAHTSPASGCSQIPPEKLVEIYCKLGYDSVVITNHFIYESESNIEERLEKYFDDYYKAQREGEKCGLNVVLGSEIRFSENFNDYLIYGIEENDFPVMEGLLGEGIDNFYKKFKNDKNVIIQAHPFRDGMSLANPESIDGIEVFNMHPGHNSRIGFAAQYAEKHNFIITGGTDYHHWGHEGMISMMTKEKILDSEQLAAVLKSRDYILDISGLKVQLY